MATEKGGGSGAPRAILRLAFGLAIFVGIVYHLAPSWSELVERVELSPWYIAVGLMGCAVAHVAVAARWKLLSEGTGGNELALSIYLHSLLVTRFLAQFAPSLAMDLVGRGVALRSAGSQRGIGHATTMVVLERIFDVVIPAGLVAWAVGVRNFGLEPYSGLLLGGGIVLFLASATPGLRPLTTVAVKIYTRLARVPAGQVPVEVGPRLSFWVALLSVVRFAAVVLQFAGIGAGIGLVLTSSEWVAATPIAQLSALVGVTPGGLGVVEAGWWAGLAWVDVEGSVIAVFLLAQRTALIAFLGALALATWPLSAHVAPAGRAQGELRAKRGAETRE